MKKLFMVEFGKPNLTGFSFTLVDPLIVLANDYEDAAQKAMTYHEQERKTQSVLTTDGSLQIDENYTTVKSVKLVTENVIK